MIFIVGNSRSGTTMLGRVLGKHSKVYTFEELHFFERLVDSAAARERPALGDSAARRLVERLLTCAREGLFAPVAGGRYGDEARAIVAAAPARDAVSLYAALLEHETRRHGKAVACEQTPGYLFYAEEILAAFPEARIVNMVRDPRDVLLSQNNKWKRRFLGARSIPLKEAVRSWANYHPLLIARLWVGCVRRARRFEAEPRFTTLRFEDLVADPETEVRRLCDALGLGFEPEMLQVPQIGSSLVADAPGRKGIARTRAGSWRNGRLAASDVGFCEWVAGSEMRRLGYEPAGPAGFRLRLLPGLATLAAKVVLALPMNLSRTKNIRETVRRRLLAE